MHDIYDSEKHCRRMLPRSSLVLYHPLQVGDRVIQGPDWQWGTQGYGEEGTITLLKRWKDTDGLAVGVLSALHDRLGCYGTTDTRTCIDTERKTRMTSSSRSYSSSFL